MKAPPSHLVVSLFAIGMISATSGRAAAGPRSACDVVPLAEVRSLVGAPVSVFNPVLSTLAQRGDTTLSTCMYNVLDAAGRPAKASRSAKLSLMWAPKAKLAKTNDIYTKRHIEAPGIKGDVLALAWIGNTSLGTAGDWSASQKLLAAALQKL
jgi:hypothetical protein